VLQQVGSSSLAVPDPEAAAARARPYFMGTTTIFSPESFRFRATKSIKKKFSFKPALRVIYGACACTALYLHGTR
jgi:hypothetical protein